MYSSKQARNASVNLRTKGVPPGKAVPMPWTQRARDGSVLRWGEAGMPSPPAVIAAGTPFVVTIAVSPVRPGHAVTVDYRVNGGPVRQVAALSEPRAYDLNARMFRAVLPGQPGGLVEFLPVLRFAGQPISPGLGESAESPRYQVGRAAAPVETAESSAPSTALPAGQPRWAWNTKFLGTLTATLRKEVVGPTPDGLRILWHCQDGSFLGSGIDAVVLSGAADWMRIRPDGVGVVNVEACFETHTGVRIYVSYGGMVDLGPDGYDRALHDNFDPLPPVVLTPTFATADKRLEWLNRAQCIGVGRVDMRALRIEFDVYAVRVGEQAHPASNGENRVPRASDDENRMLRSPASTPEGLYGRLGGYDGIAAVADDFLASGWADKQLGRYFVGHSEDSFKSLRQHLVDLLCELTGGSCVYTGRDMKTVHKGLRITEADWKIADGLFVAALNKHKVGTREQSEFMQIIRNMKSLIIEIR